MLSLVNLSRTISHVLRHAPWLYELELDDETLFHQSLSSHNSLPLRTANEVIQQSTNPMREKNNQ